MELVFSLRDLVVDGMERCCLRHPGILNALKGKAGAQQNFSWHGTKLFLRFFQNILQSAAKLNLNVDLKKTILSALKDSSVTIST